jgi:branched-chain amino acid transport system ATP-binding protein
MDGTGGPPRVTLPEGSGAAPILSVRDLSLRFGGVKALAGVSFDVAPGSITAIIGPNGAGKTSLFNCVSGFYRPASGTVLLKGRDIGRLSAPERRRPGWRGPSRTSPCSGA